MTAHWLRIQLWFLVVGLCCFGLVMITSTTAMGTNVIAAGGDGITHAFLIKQAIAMAAGAVIAMVIGSMGAERLRHGWVVALVVVGALGSLALVHVIGREINGAKRWIDLGPINLQPAELAKFAVVIAAAWHLSRVAERVRSTWYGVVVPLAGFALVAGLVYMTKDLGSVVVMAVVLGAMIVFAGAPWWYMVSIAGLCAPALIYSTVIQVSYRRDRMLAFWIHGMRMVLPAIICAKVLSPLEAVDCLVLAWVRVRRKCRSFLKNTRILSSLLSVKNLGWLARSRLPPLSYCWCSLD